MKKYVLLVLVVVVAVIAVCLGIEAVCRDKPRQEAVLKPVELHSFEQVTLHVIGMRFDQTYEILNQEDGVTVSLYDNVYENGEDVQKLDKTVTCDQDAILELLQACHVGEWNGFFGEHPKNVSDGVMFDFTAVVNDGQTICAEGSENFPEGYHDFVQALNQMLSE